MAAPVLAQQLVGVPVVDEVVVGDTPLVLNGAGVRTRLLAQIYVGALYLPERLDAAEAVLHAPGPKCIRLHFLRDAPAEQIISELLDRFQGNADAASYAELVQRIEELNGAFPDIRAGDVVRIELGARSGTEVWINDWLLAEIPGSDFQAAALKLWVGDHPADEGLKQAMLGRP